MTKKGYGELLKNKREEKNLKLPELEKVLKIDVKYLKALEDEDVSAFEKPIYHRLFLKTYAKHLRLNVDEILKLLTPDPAPTPEEKKETAKKMEIQQTKFKLAKQDMIKEIDQKNETMQSFLKQNNIIALSAAVGGLIILILLFVLAFKSCKRAEKTQEKQVYTTPVPEETIKVQIKAKEDVWMKAKYGDKEEEYYFKKGDEKIWTGVNKIVFLIGNAGGVEFNVNGDNIGVIGQEGEVINGLIFETGKNWYIDKGQGFKKMKANSPSGDTFTPVPVVPVSVTKAVEPQSQPVVKEKATVSP